MTGVVGQSAIRTDLLPGRSRQTTAIDELVEHALPLRLEDIAEPVERSRTTQAKTLAQFYELFGKVMAAARDYAGLSYTIGFSKENPPSDAELPCLTTTLISREPYEINNRREVGLRFVEEFPDPDQPGDVIQIYQRRQFNVIQVTVWAKTSKVMDELADWIEDKFFENIWLFQWCGLSHPVEWLGRERDIVSNVRNQIMFGAPIRFRVVTSKLTQKRVSTLRSIGVKAGIFVKQDVRDELP